MGAGHPSQAAVRRAVREALPPRLASARPTSPRFEVLGTAPTGGITSNREGALVLAAVSGGPDSLALAAALAAEAPALGVRGGAVIVDHRLQPGSDVVAEKAAEQCRELGLDPVEVVAVTVPRDGSGPEAAARTARYAALDEAADRLGATAILLGHTRDDQAEQVLLGLLRGSGARALAGMPPTRGRYVRPFLELPRSVTLEACDAWGVTPWRDPHNDDPNYARVRARRALVVLTEELGADPRVALARSAAQLRADADYLDAEAAAALSRFEVMATAGAVPNTSNRGEVGTVPVGDLAALPTAIRTRVWRSLLLTHGAPAGQLAHTHIAACDRLLTQWTGQGPIHVPGPLQVRRSAGRIEIAALR